MKLNTKSKIIIVDDHQLFSQSLELLIKSFGDYEVVVEALNGKEGVVECGYIASKDAQFSHFATPLLFGVCLFLIKISF